MNDMSSNAAAELRPIINLPAIADRLASEFAARAAQHDANDTFVAENVEALRAARVYSALVPSELGGAAAAHSAMCAFVRRIARACPATALTLSMHQHLVAAARYNHAAGRPGRKLLERVAADECVLVSTGANDWLESKGSVERVEGGYRVSARKAFASGAPLGRVIVTSAPYEDPAEGWQVLHFAAPLSADGVAILDDWRTLGMRGTGSNTIALDRVFVPDESITLRRPRGLYHPAWSVILTVAMPLIMSAYVGVAEAAAELALAQARKRGAAADAGLAGELGNLLTTAQLAVDDMIRLANDLDFPISVDLAAAVLARKTIAAEACIATAGKALELSGGAGFHRANGIERLLRDVQGARFHPLPAPRQHSFCGRLALGLEPIAAAA